VWFGRGAGAPVKTATELRLWHVFYMYGTKHNIQLGQFDMRVVGFSWPWLFQCQAEAVKPADFALVEYRAGRLKWH
jgi:hypothetical protein